MNRTVAEGEIGATGMHRFEPKRHVPVVPVGTRIRGIRPARVVVDRNDRPHHTVHVAGMSPSTAGGVGALASDLTEEDRVG